MFLTISFILTVLVLFFWLDTRKPKGYPPGPSWIPFLGILPLLNRLTKMLRFHHLAWHNLSLKYGPIVGAKLGGKRVILVSGKELIRDVCNNEAFDGRPDGFFFRVRSFNEKLGVVFVEGEYWQEQRRFSLRTLKHLGLGRNSMAISIEKEALEMVNFLKIKSKLGLIEMDKLFDISVLNLIWTLLAGQRFELDDERLSILTEMIHKSFRIADMSGGLLNLFPWLRFIMPEKSGYLPLLNSLKPLWKFLGDAIDTIRDRPEDEETRCFIQAFLNEMKNNQNPQRYTDKQLFVLCLDLFQAGSETTSNTLSFGIIYMLKNPEIQNKIRNELDKTIGFDRQPLLSDRPYLQYTDAVLSEIMRFATVAPLAIAHRSLEKIKLDKYVIPKDTTILLSLYSLHFDEKYWIDPHVFRPERFLDKNGQILQHDGWYLPFGFGKRRCMGENLAKSSSFLLFAAFMHAFEMELPVGVETPDGVGLDGITISPKPFKALLKPRYS